MDASSATKAMSLATRMLANLRTRSCLTPGVLISQSSPRFKMGGRAQMNKIASLLRRDPAEIQGAYLLATGVWPVVHLRSFEWTTGPKLEGWLVKTLGGLIAAIGTTLLCAAR